MLTLRRSCWSALLVLGVTHGAAAQWLKIPEINAPRRPDGQVDLTADPPRTVDNKPDLSGVWGWQPSRFNLAIGLPDDAIAPWARALAAERQDTFGKDDPANFQCVPQGPRMTMFAPLLAKIVQTPGLILVLSEDLSYRQIFMDGRALPSVSNPSFMGYSVGRWEGDTLVVETTGFKDRTWLDFAGTPHTEALRVVERIRRVRFGELEIDQTLEDTAVFRKPINVRLGARLVADTELLEYVCNENEKSRAHLVGRASDLIRADRERAVAVPPTRLQEYVGTYDLRSPNNPSTPILLRVRLDGDTLVMNDIPLIPLSDNEFGGAVGRIAFVVESSGRVWGLRLRAAEGELDAPRLPR